MIFFLIVKIIRTNIGIIIISLLWHWTVTAVPAIFTSFERQLFFFVCQHINQILYIFLFVNSSPCSQTPLQYSGQSSLTMQGTAYTISYRQMDYHYNLYPRVTYIQDILHPTIHIHIQISLINCSPFCWWQFLVFLFPYQILYGYAPIKSLTSDKRS